MGQLMPHLALEFPSGFAGATLSRFAPTKSAPGAGDELVLGFEFWEG